MTIEAAPAAGRAVEEEVAAPPGRGGKARDRLRHGALAVWSVLALSRPTTRNISARCWRLW